MVLLRLVTLTLVLLSTTSAKSISSQAHCEHETAFFVIDNGVLNSQDTVVYNDASEEDCMKICSLNKDKHGKSVLCASFAYDHAKLACTIYKEKSTPVGSAEVEKVVGKRYFEKICLPESVSSKCGDSQFIRVDDNVLVGYASNLTLVDSIELCVAQCAQEKDCKSAMFFYEDGECITNKESALSKPAAFTKEDNDKVVYFQNGCDGNQVVSNVADDDTSTEASGSTEDDQEEIEDETVTEPEIHEYAVTQISETTPKPAAKSSKRTDGEESEYEEEGNDEDVGSKDVDDNGEEADEEEEEEEVELTTTTTTTTTTEAPKKKSLKDIQKKLKKHPKNFASKTLKALKREKTVKVKNVKLENEDEDLEEEPKQPTRPLKNFESEEFLEETEQDKTDYFSEWSDWTPCTKPGERQIRRRRCLNLRKCLGALMQVQNCPAVLPTTTPENIETVRSVVGVDGDEYDDPMTTFQNDNHPVVQQMVPQLLNEQVWGPWQGVCQQFASSQPCNGGNMIGFESRECIAKDPAQCEGPFFRYCTLNC